MNKKHNVKMTTALIFALMLLLYPFTGCALQPAEKHTVPQIRFDDAEKWVRIFEDPKRAKWQQPDKVVKIMNLKPGDVVADIGAGTGYFTRRFARAVGPEGRAILNLKNYEARIVKADDPEFPLRSVDVVFLCNTYHHIDNRGDYFRKVSKGLKAGGRVVIVDFYKKELPIGPPPAHKMSQENVKKEFKQAGYKLIRSHDLLPYQYFLEFGL
jgi:predicted methyltransferase